MSKPPQSPLGRVRWACGAKLGTPSEKAVLTILALHADGQGRAWPSIATIAAMTGWSRRTVQEALMRLVAGGWLARQARRGSSTIYLLRDPGADLCPGCGALKDKVRGKRLRRAR